MQEAKSPTTETAVADRKQRIAAAFKSFPSFCGLLKIQPKEGGGRIPLILSPVQLAYNKARTSRDIVLKGRQMHMTTAEAARDLWWFLTKPGARVVVVCQSQTDDGPLKDIVYKFVLFIDSLRRLGVVLKFGTESRTEWSLPERDSTLRVIAAGASENAASKKGRGGTVNRLHASEASTYEHAEETMNALTESVPKDGSEVVIESTPKGAAGWYYEQWRGAVEGRSVYKPHFYHWWLHPEYRMPMVNGGRFDPRTDLEKSLLAKGVSPECLQWYRWKVAEKGGNEELVSQEYPSDPETCFLVSGRGFFDSAQLAKQLRDIWQPIEAVNYRSAGARDTVINGRSVPAVRIWHRAEAGKRYVIPLDVSEGSGGDAGAGLVLERGTGRHMATIWGQFKPWELARVAVWVAKKYYPGALIAPERNNHGHACLRALDAEQHYPHIFEDRDEKPGWLTSVASRANALDAFEQAFRQQNGFITHDEFLLSEMRTFVIGPTGKPEASSGRFDDLVMSAAIGWDVICRPAPRPSNWVSELPSA